MANVLVQEQSLKDIANAIREVNGSSTTYKPSEMGQAIRDVANYAKTYILETPDGSEIEAVLSEQEVVFTAEANDIREGKVAVTEEGKTVGTKVIPSYHTTEAVRVIPDGSEYIIPLPHMNKYDYTKLQVIICDYKTSTLDSVLSRKVVILDKVYDVGTDEELSTVLKDDQSKSINLGITNNSGHSCVVRYFTYKEIR